jgi:type II secretory pathway pseudopilin PulG
MSPVAKLRAAARAEHGFTMIVTLGVMLVTSLLLVAAFTVAQGETEATRNDLQRKQAYYAALAGIQQYEYELQANPDYWEKCTMPGAKVAGEENERYEVEVLKAASAPEAFTKCTSSSPFLSAIESKGSLTNTFRIKSVGFTGKASRTLIATFKVTGFLDYVYFTNFETEDPGLYNAPEGCAGKYYKEWSAKGLGCSVITFFGGDEVKGPFHTNDSARVEGSASFGRTSTELNGAPWDAIEINGGTYPEDEGESCKGAPEFNTENKCYTTKGEKLEVPPTDTSLTAYVKPKYEYSGQTRIVLNGSTDTYSVTYWKEGKEVNEASVPWPENGLIYVKSSGTCSYPFSAFGADTSTELKERKNCGDVYIKGTYSESLTVAAESNLIINGNLIPYSMKGKEGEAPTGTAVLGLIASNYVRIYHPVQTGGTNNEGNCFESNLDEGTDPNKWGSLQNPWIYAAILSTAHSFLVDNFRCGNELGHLNVYGAIAQNYRGIVGTGSASSISSGYAKDYKYDTRLATDEPPYFLAPLKAGWKVIRQTAPGPG